MNKISQLVIDNKSLPRSFSVTAQADSTRIDLYDVIDGEYGASAIAFSAALNSIKSGVINLHINSPGGDVFEARAMVAAIAANPNKIIAYVDGLAASAASYVACACDSVVMADGSMMMIHRAHSIVWGNAEDLVTMADLLDKIDSTIVSDYVRKTGMSESDILAMMTNETWMTAQEALKHGFADSIMENQKGKKSAHWNLSAYSNVPKELKEEPIEDENVIVIPDNFMTTANKNRLSLLTVL